MSDVLTRVVSPALVGREPQMRDLQAALADACRGRPTAVLLAGEAGVGKTRLIEEFGRVAAADGARVLVGRCVELGDDGLPFAPAVGALRSLLAEVGAEALADAAGPGRDELARLLPEFGTAAADSAVGRGRLFEVVATVLERLAAERPLVLVIEDLHWADGSTRDLLRFLVRMLEAARVLIVATYRSDEMHRGHPLRPLLAELDRTRAVERVEVPRLDRDDVATQLRGILGRPPAPATVDRIYARSEGNPFFVEELACCDEEAGGLPDSLRQLLLVRTERLSPPVQTLLRVAAAGGTRVDHAVLAAVTELPETELEDGLREAVAGHVLVVDGEGYSFRHALLREVLHDDLLPGEHARLHVRYARTIEQHPGLVGDRPVWVEVAHHWHAAHDVERAFTAALRAADDAAAAYAHAEERRMLDRALELWHEVDDPAATSGHDHVALLGRAAQAADDDGDPERALALVDAAVSEVDRAVDPVQLSALLQRQGRLLLALGRADGIAVLRRAVELADEGGPLDRAAARHVLSSALMLSGFLTEAERLAGEAVGLARLARAAASPPPADVGRPVPARCGVGAVSGPDHLEAAALNTRGTSLVDLGHPEEGMALLEQSREVAAAGGHDISLLRYHINLSDALSLLGRYREAVTVAQEGMTMASERGLVRTTWAFLAGNAAEPLINLGEWDHAERLITRGLELDPPYNHALHLSRLRGWLRLWQGDVEGAAAALDDVLARLRWRNPGPQYSLAIAWLAAEVALARGRPDVALDEVLAALDGEPSEMVPYVWPLLVVGARAAAAVSPGERRDLDADLATLRRFADRGDFWPTAPLARSMIEAEMAGDDAAAWEHAVTALDEAEGPVHMAGYARVRLSQALLLRGDRAGATSALRFAAETADRLGAGLLRRWVDDLSRRSRIALLEAVPDAPEAEPADGLGLTPRELEVLRLVAEGRTNRQIAEILFISTKTASVHVSHILAKLGVAGRGEAAALAHRERLFDAEPLEA